MQQIQKSRFAVKSGRDKNGRLLEHFMQVHKLVAAFVQ